jgi:hypothetical protein
MHRHVFKLGMLLGLPSLALAGCNEESTSPMAVAERTEAASTSATEADKLAPKSTPPSASVETTSQAEPAATPDPAPPAARGATKEVTFDTVKLDLAKNQPFERKLLTPQVLAIDNQRIRIRGYILPSFQQTGIKQFVLVRDNQECCFGPGAALHDCIVVDMKPGLSTEYTVRPVAVEGVFSIREMLGLEGKHLAIYHLDGEAVE